MARKSSGPWFWVERGGWYCTLAKKRHRLFVGPKDDETYQAALVEYGVVVRVGEYRKVLRLLHAMDDREKALVVIMLETAARLGLTVDQVRTAEKAFMRAADEEDIEARVADPDQVKAWAGVG